MTRYGELLATFVEWDDATDTPVSYGGQSMLGGIVRATVTKKLGAMTRGSMTLLKSANWGGLVVEGRRVGLFQSNAVLQAATGTQYREMGGFLVQSVREKLRQDGQQVVEVTGLGTEHLLTKVKHWEAIGEETIYSTYLTVAAPEPWTTTVYIGAPAGNDSVSLNSNDDVEVGDEIRIQMDNDDWYVGTITGVDPPGAPNPNTVQYLPRLPFDASPGNDVEFRKGRLTVNSIEGFAEGQRIIIELDAGPPHHTTVLNEVNKGTTEIEIRDGLPSAASVENIVQVYDYSEPALDDVEQILAPATGWTVAWGATGDVHGTEDGTAHAPHGESAWDLLIATAEQTGENFRIGVLNGGTIPRRRIFWFRDNDSSGVTLYLRVDSEDVAADTELTSRGVIYSLERERAADIVTRVYPISGDGRIDLEYCTPAALAEAATEGFSVVVSTDLFQPDYVQYGAGVTEHGVLEGTFRFGNVTLPRKASLRELQAAADAMLKQSMGVIKESQRREYWRVECHTHKPLYPGQSIAIHNMTGTQPQTAATYYILEVRETYDAGVGVIKTSLLVSTSPQLQPDSVLKLGRELKAAQMEARRKTFIEENATATATVVSGGGSGDDHGGLTGLTDDDHPQYLRTDGSRALAGNLAVAGGMTVDGVDISAHAADADAHHTRVTAYDGSLEVMEGTQQVRVAPAFAGNGLALSAGGVASVNVGLAYGTTLDDDTVAVGVAHDGGLALSEIGLRVKRPTNSGLGSDETGLWLNPGTLSAATDNAVSGTSHSHAVLAYADTKANPGHLMEADGNGDHRLRWLSADKVRTPAVETESGALTLDPVAALVNVDGDLTFTGGSRWARTNTGDLTLAPAGELHFDPTSNVAEVQPTVTLKTAHWASGFLGTGWGLTYDGHLDTRSIYADELHVAAFIADTARVAVGSEYITPSMALLSEDFTAPAVGASGSLVVDDAPGLANLPVFDNGDWVLLRVMSRAGGGLVVANVWGQVTGYGDGPGEGQQTWTFTTRNTSAAGQLVAAGSIALDFGKSGAGWWWVTSIDPAGSPYAGISTWQGDNPYTEGNRSHVLRLGQLKGVTGAYEWGLHAGSTTSRKIRFSDLASEIHGTRLSLYAGDGAQLRVAAAEVRLYRDISNYATLLPNADHGILNVISTAGLYYTTIDEGVGSASAADYVANDTNTGGALVVGLTDPSPWGAIYGAQIAVAMVGSGFSNDTVKLFAQVFGADGSTPLTSEKLVYTMAGNTSVNTTVAFDQVDKEATQSAWNGARLRLRWEYAINSSDEAIRLDPQVPSVAVGRGLPTGYEAGGDGFWVGADAGLYKLRIGKASGVGLRWTGTAMELRNSANAAVIELDSSGNSRFAGPMTLGTSGGIWQGTGTFAAPTTGLKIFNASGVGRLSTYNGGVEQITVNTSGQLTAGQGRVVLDASGLTFRESGSGYVGGRSSEIKFVTDAGVQYGHIAGHAGTGANLLRIGADTLNYHTISGTGWFATVEEMNFNVISGSNTSLLLLTPGSFTLATNAGAALTTPSGSYVNASGLRTTTGLTVGHSSSTPPNAVIRLTERAGLPTVPAGFADIYLGSEGGVQGLYIKFAGQAARKII